MYKNDPVARETYHWFRLRHPNNPAEDLVQECYIREHKYYDPAKSSRRTFWWRIRRSVLSTHLRKQNTQKAKRARVGLGNRATLPAEIEAQRRRDVDGNRNPFHKDYKGTIARKIAKTYTKSEMNAVVGSDDDHSAISYEDRFGGREDEYFLPDEHRQDVLIGIAERYGSEAARKVFEHCQLRREQGRNGSSPDIGLDRPRIPSPFPSLDVQTLSSPASAPSRMMKFKPKTKAWR